MWSSDGHRRTKQFYLSSWFLKAAPPPPGCQLIGWTPAWLSSGCSRSTPARSRTEWTTRSWGRSAPSRTWTRSALWRVWSNSWVWGSVVFWIQIHWIWMWIQNLAQFWSGYGSRSGSKAMLTILKEKLKIIIKKFNNFFLFLQTTVQYKKLMSPEDIFSQFSD